MADSMVCPNRPAAPPPKKAGETPATSTSEAFSEHSGLAPQPFTEAPVIVLPGSSPETPAIKDDAYSTQTASSPARPSGDIFANLEGSFVLVHPGAYLMGSPEYEAGRGSDEVIHEVTLTRPFHIQKAPVTQKLWQAVMGNNPASFKESAENFPVETVTWNECQEFLRRLNEFSRGRRRLPTEAEWECACRAGGATAFSTGDISELYCGRDEILWQTGWYCANSGRRSCPVGRKNPNGWGLLDMHGNIGEWCLDWYGSYPAASCQDPLGPNGGTVKVVRGGSWFSSAKNCRSASRFYWPPNLKSDCIGFRLVKETS